MFGRCAMALGAWMTLVGAAWTSVDAQTVRGTVTDRGTRANLQGVIVVLLDSTGAVVGRALVGDRGVYEVSASRAGTYRLRTLRIGFRPTTSPPVRLAEGGRLTRDLELAAIPISLDTIRVVDRSPCRSLRDSAALTYGIWEQVRTAFLATELTKARMYETTIVTYQRHLEPASEHVLMHNATVRTGVTTGPWIARDSVLLRQTGYVIRDGDRSTTYYAPDLNVLLSGMFVQDHCFALRADEMRVGIAFEPTRDRRDIPEIEGVVWLDRKTSELQRLEFRYVNVARQLAAGRAGAEMEFARMANGTWMITRWYIRMPVLVSRITTSGLPEMRRTEGEVAVAEIRLEGGELALAKRGNDTLWSRPPMVVSGVVVDSTSGTSIAGARLSINGTPLGAVSDSLGQFSIAGLLPGEYTLSIHTSALDVLGANYQTPLTLADNSKALRLAVPSPLQLARCGGGDGKLTELGMLVGTVRVRGDTTRPANAQVTAEWSPSPLGDGATTALREAQGRQVHGRTGASGMFRLCGIPLRTLVTVRARGDSATSEPKELEIPPLPRVGRVDLVLETNPLGPGSFSGSVFVDSTERPISGAEVLLPALAKSTVTNENGAFRLNDIPAGEHDVIVRRMGYLPLATRLVFTAREPLVHRIYLSHVVVLDTIAVSATRVLAEFEDNRRLGLGHFLTRAELAKVEEQKLATILSQTPGLKIIGGGSRAWVASSRGNRTLTNATVLDRADGALGAKPGECYAQVYLDNALVYRGLDREPLFDINSISTFAIEAIEYYASPAQTPARYLNLDSQCGVLVIWTRRSP